MDLVYILCWLGAVFTLGVLCGTFAMYFINRKCIAEFRKIHDNLHKAHERLIEILVEWQKLPKPPKAPM